MHILIMIAKKHYDIKRRDIEQNELRAFNITYRQLNKPVQLPFLFCSLNYENYSHDSETRLNSVQEWTCCTSYKGAMPCTGVGMTLFLSCIKRILDTLLSHKRSFESYNTVNITKALPWAYSEGMLTKYIKQSLTTCSCSLIQVNV